MFPHKKASKNDLKGAVCQATRTRPASVSVRVPDGLPILLCDEAAKRMKRYALRPREWLNLATIHRATATAYFDISDLYTPFGEAVQPKERVTVPPSLAFPDLSDPGADLETLLDVAYAWEGADYSDGDLPRAIRRFPEATIREALGRRMQVRPLPEHFVPLTHQLGGQYLTAESAEWAREQWRLADNRTDHSSLVLLSISVLGINETVERVIDAMKSEDSESLSLNWLTWHSILPKLSREDAWRIVEPMLDRMTQEHAQFFAAFTVDGWGGPLAVSWMESRLPGFGFSMPLMTRYEHRGCTFAPAVSFVQTEWFVWGEVAAASRIGWASLVRWLEGSQVQLRLAALGALLVYARVVKALVHPAVRTVFRPLASDERMQNAAKHALQRMRLDHGSVAHAAADTLLKYWDRIDSHDVDDVTAPEIDYSLDDEEDEHDDESVAIN